MSMRITDDCINCGACAFECPNHAIYEAGVNWNYSINYAEGFFQSELTKQDSPTQLFQPLNNEFYYIVPDKCTECYSISKEPQCLTICPIDCIENYKIETEGQLKQKILLLHDNKPENYLKYNENKRIRSDHYCISEEFIDEKSEEKKSKRHFLIKISEIFKLK
jgi:ferredoxin